MKNKLKNKQEEFLKEIEFEEKEMRKIFGRTPSLTSKIIKSVILTILAYAIFLLPNMILVTNYKSVAYTMYTIIFIIIGIVALIRKKYKNIDLKDIVGYQILNIFSVSIFYVLFFIGILAVIPEVFSFYAQYYYLSIYEYLETGIYISLTSILMPATETFLLRTLINKFDKKPLKIFFVVFNTILIFIIQPHFIYGLFFAIISLVLNIYVLKTKRTFASFVIQVIVNLVFNLSLLYLSTYKLPILIIFAFIFLISLMLNTYKLASKEK